MSDRWQRIGALFDQAVLLSQDERQHLLAAAPEADDIKNEVRSLLAAHDDAGSFLEERRSALPALPALATGTQLGSYRVLRLLGRGGMGVVYEAEDVRLHRRVALKALPPELAGDERQRQRLRHEARAAAALQHPGIATIYALEEIDGHMFITSELLHGRTLREELDAGALEDNDVLAAALAVAQAMCAAHERGVVHRDLKPENIMRTEDGTLKILDFGVAQLDSAADDAVSGLSMTGLLAGTPAYMAPEQLIGGQTDFRVDQFAFGVLAYELATRRHPFAAGSLPSTVARILAVPPDMVPVAHRAPEPLVRVIARCLEKDPARRFASTRDLVNELMSGTVEPATTDTPHPQAAVPRSSSPPPTTTQLDPRKQRLSTDTTSALQWWRFHQLAAALAYWAMVWPVWHVHRAVGRFGLFFFFAILAAVVVAANLRLHLWFSSRVYPQDLPTQHASVATWIRAADLLFAVLLVAGGVALPDDRAAWAAVLISFGIGAAVVFTFVEPATTRAAFRSWYTE